MTAAMIERPEQPLIDVTSIENWQVQGDGIFTRHRHILWEVAAWLEAGVREFGDQAQAIALEQFGKSKAEIKNAMDVAQRFPEGKRRPELTFGHHAAVVMIDEDQADEILDDAVQNKASIAAVKKAVNQVRESKGGDIFQIMASVNYDELVDDWTGKMIRLSNRAPSQEARDQFLELLADNANGLVIE
jgi:hypothetical protein